MRRSLVSSVVVALAVVAVVSGTVLFAHPAGAAPPRFLTLPFKTSTYYVTTTFSSGHPAYDLDPGGSAQNASIVAAAAGKATVKRTTYYSDTGCSQRELNAGGFGLYVVIQHANGYKTIYAHLASAAWPVGTTVSVSRGQKIGG